MEYSFNGWTVLITVLLIIGLFIYCLYLYVRLRDVRNEYIQYRLYHQKAMAVYIEVFKKNRKLANWIVKLKSIINAEVFSKNHLDDITQIVSLYNKYECPTGFPKELLDSSKIEFEKIVEEDKKVSRYYAESIDHKSF